ncbi:hypothetical protein DOTSEDRAFT_39364 [Dothistroma septosporum NZE10]|uniref:Uncharacterized protein n=1 Tax=Dothistroma septosporum (strain NZE10 / CBS 128990) TaxID=675120 RepID=N1PD19_DOTSN|nr:hypothetical protein DOTSEDRAFT_39364 [Dothistroma septosporum NZE10]
MSNHRNIFPFFSLPRELRDLIYPYLVFESGYIPLTNELRFHVYDYPLPHLFRINHQFKSELDETVLEISSLSAHHAGIAGLSLGNAVSELPPPLKGIRMVRFDVQDKWEDNLIGGVKWNDAWIRGILNDMNSTMSKPMQIAIHIHLGYHTTAEDMESAILWSGIWVDRGEVQDLKITRPGRERSCEDRIVLSHWNREARQFVRVAKDLSKGREENVSGPAGLLWQGEVAYLFE